MPGTYTDRLSCETLGKGLEGQPSLTLLNPPSMQLDSNSILLVLSPPNVNLHWSGEIRLFHRGNPLGSAHPTHEFPEVYSKLRNQPNQALSAEGSFSSNQQASTHAPPEAIQVVGNQPQPLAIVFFEQISEVCSSRQAADNFSVM